MNSFKNRQSRRNFIKTTSVGTAGLIAAPTILSQCAKGANNRIMVANIGVGSMGFEVLKNWLMPVKGVYNVATCDPFLKRRNDAAQFVNETYKREGVAAPECKPYLNFEEILERPDIDAVNIHTTDQWHVPIAIKAARAGKHIMLAKPLGLSYPDFKILEKEVKANDVRFHYATQQRSQEHMKVAIEMVKEGKIGEIEKVDVWAPGKSAAENPVCNEVPVPDGFDYDLWSGPAPLNPYCPERVTNEASWFQWDYSIGFLAGWGAHPLDIMIWGLKDKMNGVYSCEGEGGYWGSKGIYNNITSWDLYYTYDSGVKLHFMSTDVVRENDVWSYRKMKDSNTTTFFGTKGWISVGRNSAESDVQEIQKRFDEFRRNEEGWIMSPTNMGYLFAGIIHGEIEETCPLDEAILSDTISHMGNIAIRAGKKITWDPAKGQVINDNEAFSKWFVRDMREPYTI